VVCKFYLNCLCSLEIETITLKRFNNISQDYRLYSEPIVNHFLVIVIQTNNTKYPTRGAMSC